MMKDRLGHYDIVGELGRGGMGVVYKGYEPSLNRHVAIKVLAESLAHDPAVKERFLREARAMAALNDAHIIQIHFIGEDEGRTYFVMELVDGESLGAVLQREMRLTPEQAARIVHQTAQGLATAHDQGVIHRDIKPGNLMVSSRGAVKIADFGIALSMQDFSKKLTMTGEFVGTPGYLSPEVCLGKPVDPRSDIFSLGIVLFECLAGRMPFTDQSPLGLMLEVVKAEIPDVRALNADVDAELSRILGKMIAREPDDRYRNCHELAADLGRHPLIANGGTLRIAARPKMGAMPETVLAPAGAAANAGATTVRRATPPRMAASQPMLARSPVPPGARSLSGSRWAAIGVGAVLIAASAWGYRDDLPFLKSAHVVDARAPLPAAPVASLHGQAIAPPLPRGRAEAGVSDDGVRVAAEAPLHPDMSGTTAASTNGAAIDIDALVLDELQADGDAPPPRAPHRGPYAYPPALLPVGFAPVAYAPPWHVGIGLGIGFWSAYAWPRAVYVGPVLPPPALVSHMPGPAMPAPVRAAAPQPVAPPVDRMRPNGGAMLAATRAPAVMPPSGIRTPMAQQAAVPAQHAGVSAMPTTQPPAVRAGVPAAVAVAGNATQRSPQNISLRAQGNGVANGPRQMGPNGSRGRERMLENQQKREAFLANQNARRAAAAEAKAAQARAARVHASAAQKPKPQRRKPRGE